MKNWQQRGAVILALAAFTGAVVGQSSVTSRFTYQGQLRENGVIANGNYDLRFALYGSDVGGTSIGELVLPGVPVTRGVFTVALDFGTDVFQGDRRWLAIAVRPASTGDYVWLQARQELTATPYAEWARNAANATNAEQLGGRPASEYLNTETPAGGDLTGFYPDPTIGNGKVTLGKLAPNSVNGDKIVDGTVRTADLDGSAVTSAKLANDAASAARVSGGVIASDGSLIHLGSSATPPGALRIASSDNQLLLYGAGTNRHAGIVATKPAGQDDLYVIQQRGDAHNENAYVGNLMTISLDTGYVRCGGVDGVAVTPTHPFELISGAKCDGMVWYDVPDQRRQENVVRANSRQELERLARLSLATWNYIDQGREVTHIGPTAQDFYNTFGYGQGGDSLAPLDVNGVLIAAVQALYEMVSAQGAEAQPGSASPAAAQLSPHQSRALQAIEERVSALEQERDTLVRRLAVLEARLAEQEDPE